MRTLHPISALLGLVMIASALLAVAPAATAGNCTVQVSNNNCGPWGRCTVQVANNDCTSNETCTFQGIGNSCTTYGKCAVQLANNDCTGGECVLQGVGNTCNWGHCGVQVYDNTCDGGHCLVQGIHNTCSGSCPIQVIDNSCAADAWSGSVTSEGSYGSCAAVPTAITLTDLGQGNYAYSQSFSGDASSTDSFCGGGVSGFNELFSTTADLSSVTCVLGLSNTAGGYATASPSGNGLQLTRVGQGCTSNDQRAYSISLEFVNGGLNLSEVANVLDFASGSLRTQTMSGFLAGDFVVQ